MANETLYRPSSTSWKEVRLPSSGASVMGTMIALLMLTGDSDYHPLRKILYRPFTVGALVWVPLLVLCTMCFFALRIQSYDSIEDFGEQVGAYTPPDAEEVLSQPLVSSVKRRKTPHFEETHA